MAKIKFRRDTTANWATANSVLSQGEPGLDITTNSLKVGDGTTAWANLEYIANQQYPTPNIAYTGVFGGLPNFWKYNSSPSKRLSTATGEFIDTTTGLYSLDEHFDDQNYDLSGTTSLRFLNIGAIKGYLDISDKSEVVMHTLDLGNIAVVDEWFQIAGFSNTLTSFYANNLIDVGSTFEIYGMQQVNGITLSFPALDRISDTLYINYNYGSVEFFANTAAPSFPALTFVGFGMQIHNNKYTSWSDFTSLTNLRYSFNFYENTNNDGELFDGPGMPALTHLQNGTLYYYNNTGMQYIPAFTLLNIIEYGIYIYNNPDLTSFPSFPALTYVNTIEAYNNPSMTGLAGSNPGGWLPSILRIDGNVNFQGCALNETSVNLILVKLAALDGTSGTTSFDTRTINLNQGTNAIPTGDGLTAKTTLEGRGCTVNVNS